MTDRTLLDDDGENLAVRCFLMLYGCTNSPTVKNMRRHLELSGFPHWPAWVNDPANDGHLTKGGAQDWLRYLFGLEATLSLPSTEIPEEWVLVPMEATDDMVTEGAVIQGGYDPVDLREVYRVMVDAAISKKQQP